MIREILFNNDGATTTTVGDWNPRANIVPYDQATLTPTADAVERMGAAAAAVACDLDEISDGQNSPLS